MERLLLFTIFALAFFGALRGIGKFTFCGDYGKACLRRCAEESGDPKKIIFQRYTGGLARLYFAMVLTAMLVSGVFMTITLSNGDSSWWINLAVLLALAAALVLAALFLRRRTRRAVSTEQARRDAEAESLGADASFTIYYLDNPRRIDTLMKMFVFLCYLLFFGLIFTYCEFGPWLAEYNPWLAVFDAAVGLGSAICIAWVVRECRRVFTLMRVDRRGITYSGQGSDLDLLPWEEIKSISVFEKAVELQLSLPRRVDGTPTSQISLPLADSLTSWVTVDEKLRLFRELAREEKEEKTEEPNITRRRRI